MEIDYKKYSLEELYDVLRNIDTIKYPERVLIVEEQIQIKKNDPAYIEIQRISKEKGKYSTFWNRFFAHWIDGFVFIPLSVLSIWLMNMFANDTYITYHIQSFNTIAVYLYTIVFHGAFGATIGKMVCGVKVIDKEENKELSYKQAFIRDSIPLFLSMVVVVISHPKVNFDLLGNSSSSFFIVLFSIVGSLSVLWSITEIITMLSNKKRRALHDFIAGSVVVKI
jgi:uncharacterized RDD family membrane protein YckC